jgi:hypothetical protein
MASSRGDQAKRVQTKALVTMASGTGMTTDGSSILLTTPLIVRPPPLQGEANGLAQPHF